MAVTEFSAALNQVATERGIPVESVLESIRMALVSAYKKDYGGEIEDFEVDLNSDSGEAKILREGSLTYMEKMSLLTKVQTGKIASYSV